jgi:CBS domain-containing protein
MKLRDLMTRDVITIGPEAPLKEAARRMLEASVSGLPVTDADGKLVGMITEADFVATEADRRRRRRAGLLRFIDRGTEVPSQERLVGDVMTTDLVVMREGGDHAEAARLMQTEDVKRIPVVDDHRRIVGLVSRADILRVFARSDNEILDEIEDDLIRRVLWIDPRRADIRSTDGNVVLRGRLETRSDAELLAELAGRVDGVISVENHLEFDVDNLKLDMTGIPPGSVPRRNWTA